MGDINRMLIQMVWGNGRRDRVSECKTSLKRRHEGEGVTRHAESAVKTIPGREKSMQRTPLQMEHSNRGRECLKKGSEKQAVTT